MDLEEEQTMNRRTSGQKQRTWLPLVIATAALALLSATVSLAQSGPDTMNFQGRLLDSSGNPLGGEAHCMRFRICLDGDCAEPLWPNGDYEYHLVTTEGGTYKDGLFNVALGNKAPIVPTLFYGFDDLFLEIGVSEADSGCDGAGEEYAVMMPRSQLRAHGYAQRSRRVHTRESDSTYLVSVTNTGSGGAIYAETDSTAENAAAGYFKADAESGQAYGLRVTSDSMTNGATVAGFTATGTTGATSAVTAVNNSTSSGATAGYFENAGTFGAHSAVVGLNWSTSEDSTAGNFAALGPGFGVQASAGDGYGVRAKGGFGDVQLASLHNPGTIVANDATGSDLELHSNDYVDVHLDDDSDSASMFRVLNGANQVVFAVDEAGNMTGQTQNTIASAPVMYSTSFQDSCSSHGAISVTVAGPGTVIVQANARVRLVHTQTVKDQLKLGIGENETHCGNPLDQILWSIPPEYPTAAEIDHTFTVRNMYQIDTAGTHTYYLNGYMEEGYSPATDMFLQGRMHAVFYPG
jgi:hypothetical protein